jgi:hypothetical protein
MANVLEVSPPILRFALGMQLAARQSQARPWRADVLHAGISSSHYEIPACCIAASFFIMK